ncbi:MAG: helix-hairpin-helix domain-containing protein [Zetaproteobacteria bacterium CG_4_9_14_3_um_filter_53_7]|nr:MAG: helix-hairpin-helix domain-containing protein [Zetaproteobacteria bacterium CG_4_9_14_3_um_filter_53_7]
MKHLLTDITGIGESTAALLAEHGIDSVKTLRKTGIKKLCRVPGFSETRATVVLASADALTASDKAHKQAEKDAIQAARQTAKDAEKAEKLAAKNAKKVTRQTEKETAKLVKQADKDARKAKKTNKADKPKKGKKKKK